MKNVIVADIMTRSPITVNPETNLLECAKTMVRKRVGSLLLVKEGVLTGFLSQKDILWALIKKSKNDLSKIKAKDISAKKITTIKPSASIEDAIRKMKLKKFDRLPVVQKKELMGLITAKDILSFNPEVYPEFDELDMIREEEAKLKRLREIRGDNIGKEGICEECGNRGFLTRFNGMLVCGYCRDNK